MINRNQLVIVCDRSHKVVGMLLLPLLLFETPIVYGLRCASDTQLLLDGYCYEAWISVAFDFKEVEKVARMIIEATWLPSTTHLKMKQSLLNISKIFFS